MFVAYLFFFCKRKRRSSSAFKDYSLFSSWLSSLLMLKSNNTINRQINSKEVTIVAPPFTKYFLYEKDVYIILCFISKYKRAFNIFTYFSNFIELNKYNAILFCCSTYDSISLASANISEKYYVIFILVVLYS